MSESVATLSDVPLLNRDPDDRRPLYQRVGELLSDWISGMAPGQEFPSEAGLSEQLRVSRSTVREALRGLELDGRVERSHGRGTTVARPTPLVAGLTRLESLESLAARQGWRCGTQDVDVTTVEAPPNCADALGLAAGETVVHLSRVKTRDWKPICLMQSWLPDTVITSRHLREEFSDSITELLLARQSPGLGYSVAEVSAIAASPDVADRLRLARASALVNLQETFYTQAGLPFCYSESLFVPGSVRFEVMRRPESG